MRNSNCVVADSADVDRAADIGEGTRVWHLAQIRDSAIIGRKCIIGRGAYVDAGANVGDRCKVQNNALIYAPAEIGSGVFIGPAAVLTNDTYPRAITPSGELKSGNDWHPVGVTIADGASIGAGAVCVAPVNIGRWALVAAGSVVIHDVPAYALVAGNPARHIGWVGRAGHKLIAESEQRWRCPVTTEIYAESVGELSLIAPDGVAEGKDGE